VAEFRTEDALVGIVALGVVPWIGWTLMRGARDGRLPILRRHVVRAERPGPFAALFGLYVVAAFAMAWIGFDLLLDIRSR
jgi:hypothetical protein